MKLRPASWSVSSGILRAAGIAFGDARPKPNTAYGISFFAKASKDYSPRLHPTNELVGIRRRRIKKPSWFKKVHTKKIFLCVFLRQ